MNRPLTASAYVAMLVVLIGSLGQSALASTLTAAVTGAQPAAAEATPLLLTAQVPALFPGLRATLAVQVTSTSTENAKVLTLSARVGDAAPGCAAGNVAVTGYALSTGGRTYVVPAGGTITVPLPITMLNTDTNQDACKGVTFPIELTATSSA